MRISRFLLIASGGIFLAQAAIAATVELMPLVGFQVNGARDLAGPANNRLDLRNVPFRGLSIGYMNQENGELEFSWTRANSAAQIQQAGGFPPDRFDVRIDQFHLNAIFLANEGAFQPFGLVGAGATHFTPKGDRSTTTLFSMAIGGGIKWLWTDHIGIRLDGRWTPALAPSGTHFFCDSSSPSGCYSAQSNSSGSKILPLLQSVDITAGLLLRY